MCDSESHQSQTSSFIFGLIFGAVIASIVAIYIYKNNKTDIFENLTKYLQNLFGPPKAKSRHAKISVTLPPKVETLDLTPPKSPKPKKMFKK